jgi:uncharacterized membrane protein
MSTWSASMVRGRLRSLLLGLLKNECGQVLPIAAVIFVALLGMAGLAIDVGHVFYCNRALQAAADAAALAGGGSMRTATSPAAVIAAATSFSAVPGSVNASGSLPNVTMVSGYPLLKCLTTLQNLGIACVGAVPYNALQIREQAVVPMYLAALFGMKVRTTWLWSSIPPCPCSSPIATVAVPRSRVQ